MNSTGDNRRGWVGAGFCLAGWVVLVLLVQTAHFRDSYLGLAILLVFVLIVALVSVVVVVSALVRRSWVVALVSAVLTAAAMVTVAQRFTGYDYIGEQYRAHRVALAGLAADFRAGRLDGVVELPPDVRELSPSGYAYANSTELFVQMWQDWRAESGTGLAYLTAPPTPRTWLATADGDLGQPLREVGDGWWWVA